MTARRLTQAQLAKLLHVTQPRVSDLLRGHVERFSADALIDLLARLGLTVRLVLQLEDGATWPRGPALLRWEQQGGLQPKFVMVLVIPDDAGRTP